MLAVEYRQDPAVEGRMNRNSTAKTGGDRVTLRVAHQNDAVLIQEMHERLSADSIYYRYLGPNKPTIENLQCLCSSNGVNGTALVATIKEPDEKVIAVAYYRIDPSNPTKAEPAVLVEDSFQGRGVGKQIMQALCKDAIQKGLETFDTFIDPANYRVMQLIKGSGLRYKSQYRDGLLEIRVWLRSST